MTTTRSPELAFVLWDTTELDQLETQLTSLTRHVNHLTCRLRQLRHQGQPIQKEDHE